MRQKTVSKLIAFFKKETVLCIAFLLAVVSSFFVPPSREYLSYPDYRVLALLFCLMSVVAGFKSIGFFQYLADRLLKGAATTRSLSFLLVALCFFSSMLITNDVALLTFVPFAVMLLSMAGEEKLLIPLVVLQTIAANLGSMLTPVGNPQNLYLYSAFGISMGSFLLYMLPLTLLSALLLTVSILLLPDRKLTGIQTPAASPAQAPARGKLLAFFVLFLICLLCVVRVLPWPVMLLLLTAAVFVLDKSLFRQVDYCLLLTFVSFFVFIGNMERLPSVSALLARLIGGRELLLGIVLSQCISNVPAAILLSGFTEEARPLLYGVDVGGLGTLIASLASVISYKLYCNTEHAEKGKYLKVFTLYNVCFLILLYCAARLLLALT